MSVIFILISKRFLRVPNNAANSDVLREKAAERRERILSKKFVNITGI